MFLRFPSKDTSYANSIIAYFPAILEELVASDMSVRELYQIAHDNQWDLTNFFAALDSLYALGRIDFDEGRMVLRYVAQD